MSKTFGYVAPQSTNQFINFIAADQKDQLLSVVGKMMYFDTRIEDRTYRAIGTVTDIRTENNLFNPAINNLVAQGNYNSEISKDIRLSSFVTQAVFVKDDSANEWSQSAAYLPTSPKTHSTVHLLDEAVLEEMTAGQAFPSAGTFRGLNLPLPINTPDFGGNRGASHSGVLGKSGSGKDLALDTPIPTPSGWTTMGDLQDGDLVFNENGEPIRVTKAHEILTNSKCYEVEFSDGSVIVAGAGHLWYTETQASRRSASQNRNKNRSRDSLLSQEIITHLRRLAYDVSDDSAMRIDDFLTWTGIALNITSVERWASKLTPVGIKSKMVTGRVQKASHYTRNVKFYNKRDTLTHILSQRDSLQRFKDNPQLAMLLEAELEVASSSDKVIFADVTSALGVNAKNGSVRRLMNKVPFEVAPRTYSTGEYIHRDYTSSGSPSYLVKELLNLVAEEGSKIVNDQRDKIIIGSVKTTEEIKNTLVTPDSRKTWNHSIPVTKAVQYPKAKLSVDPYLLGAWLGDGKSGSGLIYSSDKEMKDLLSVDERFPIVREKVQVEENRLALYTWRFENLTKTLRSIGVINNKHIPAEYLISSIDQRKELLAGLLDTDGNATESASVEFTSTKHELAKGVHELACSLGYRATITERDATLYGRIIGKKWTIRFSTDEDVFHLKRKNETHRTNRVNFNASKNNQRYIVDVREVPTVPTRCITVEGESALYLAGRTYIPTHNTAGYTFVLSTYMRHEQHAIVVVDPQGQWSNENGFIFSPQKFAESLGREVKLIRIAEEVRLPKDPELLGRLIEQMKAWTRLRRMGAENQAIFSQEVAERIVRQDLNEEPRKVLSKAFLSVAHSKAAMRRIYADEKLRDVFKLELEFLAGYEDKSREDYEEPSAEDYEDVESSWESILKVFQPLLNLFSSTNLHGERRHPLGGDKGILSDIFQVRKAGGKPAPYVIIDMSPDVKTHAKRALNNNDIQSNMAALLDKESVKALILQVLFQEIKKASETAYALTGGNLNTQIVFDEAWRYAPEGKAIPEIEELADMLEGFAFDTRKFGIGWTYILQSPSDLKKGIWSQLTYIYAAYGLVGADIKVMEERYSDLSQTEIYKGFISPASTGVYPMMVVGSISPLIFTNAPTFMNMFTDAQQFLDANRKWINGIVTVRGLPLINASVVDPNQMKHVTRVRQTNVETKSYRVGKNYETSEPQTPANKKPVEVKTDDDMDTPF